jgi:hypothetical protein
VTWERRWIGFWWHLGHAVLWDAIQALPTKPKLIRPTSDQGWKAFEKRARVLLRRHRDELRKIELVA